MSVTHLDNMDISCTVTVAPLDYTVATAFMPAEVIYWTESKSFDHLFLFHLLFKLIKNRAQVEKNKT